MKSVEKGENKEKSSEFERILEELQDIKKTIKFGPPIDYILRNQHILLNKLAEKRFQRFLKLYEVLGQVAGSYLVVDRKDIYRELIEFIDIIIDTDSVFPIRAVASQNIEDFLENPYGESYLDANRLAVENGIPVSRIFVVDRERLYDLAIIKVIVANQTVFGNRNKTYGVKIIESECLDKKMQGYDFTLIDNCIAARQEPIYGTCSIYLGEKHEFISEAKKVFKKLWKHKNVKNFDIYKKNGISNSKTKKIFEEAEKFVRTKYS